MIEQLLLESCWNIMGCTLHDKITNHILISISGIPSLLFFYALCRGNNK